MKPAAPSRTSHEPGQTEVSKGKKNDSVFPEPMTAKAPHKVTSERLLECIKHNSLLVIISNHPPQDSSVLDGF